MRLALNFCSILLIPCLLFGADVSGAGGRADSSVVLRYEKGLGQDGDITSYNKIQGDVLYSRCYLFDIAARNNSVYTRGTENLFDSTFYGNKYLDLQEFMGQFVHVTVFTSVVTTCSLEVYVEQGAIYDSTAFDSTAAPSNWNFGYIQTDQIFDNPATDGKLGGATNGAVVKDSFYVAFPIVRLKITETENVASGRFLFTMYMRTPDDIRSAPAGIRRDRLFDDRMKQLIKETKANK